MPDLPNLGRQDYFWVFFLGSLLQSSYLHASVHWVDSDPMLSIGALLRCDTLIRTRKNDIQGGHFLALRYNDEPDRERTDSLLCWRLVIQNSLLSIRRNVIRVEPNGRRGSGLRLCEPLVTSAPEVCCEPCGRALRC